jgi:hypothetical protein
LNKTISTKKFTLVVNLFGILQNFDTMALTGQWRLNHEKRTSQSALLRSMGRKRWEMSVIDKADEDFRLVHFCKPVKKSDPSGGETEEKQLHFFDIQGVIYLKSTLLKVLSAIFPIEVDKVRFHHKLVANNKEKQHHDDEKRFGPCTSLTSWEIQGGAFTIRWHLPGKGVLKVFHTLNPDGNLELRMDMIPAKGPTESAIKVFERLPPSDELRDYLQSHPHREHLAT